MKALLIVCGLLTTLPAMVLAAKRSVTLSVPSMDCPVCPITVKKALTKVSGVSGAEVNFERRQAKVTFDDSKTSVEALTRATGDAGYPSTVVTDPK
jgi:mercuric ion binding protein